MAGRSVAGGEAGELQPGEAALVAEARSADATARTPLPTQPQLPVDNTQQSPWQQGEDQELTGTSAHGRLTNMDGQRDGEIDEREGWTEMETFKCPTFTHWRDLLSDLLHCCTHTHTQINA